ncbi:MAG: hypothetical protein ACI4DN_06325 [Lachnospiraceae bacterium]
MSNTYSMREEIRLQRKKLKGKPLKKQWEYYWNYYKVPAVIILIAACIFGSLLHTLLFQKETVLSVAYINAFPNMDDATFMEGFNRYININSKKQDTVLDSSYYITENSASPYSATYQQKLSAMAYSGKLDVVIADEYYFRLYAEKGFFQDLTSLLSREELARFKEDFLYCDLPEDGRDEAVPVGINISNAPGITRTSSYPNSTCYYGIVINSGYTDNARSFLEWLETDS